MCGIVGYVGAQEARTVLVDGLRRLEYRGYDSSGLAVIESAGVLERVRAVGKIRDLETVLSRQDLPGTAGLGHTRWATHGIPSEENAHPHTGCEKKIVVVHNGIIENYLALKSVLMKAGHRFSSQTDTEVIAHLIEEQWARSKKKKSAVKDPQALWAQSVSEALKKIEGSYALGVLNADFPDLIIAARQDCPLAVGLGENENFMASDVTALIPHTRKVIFLNQGEVALLRKKSVQFQTFAGNKINKKPVHISWNAIQAEKSGYKHFMLKEMMEQPQSLADTLRSRVELTRDGLSLGIALPQHLWSNLERIKLIACGTSYHAALVARFWLESIAQVPCDVEIASEFRYRKILSRGKELAIFISQSGETADTLAALREVKSLGMKTLAICNVLGSSLTQEADAVLYTQCGPEIGVASTKAFTGQLVALYLVVLHVAFLRGQLDESATKERVRLLLKIPQKVRQALVQSAAIETLAHKFIDKEHFLYLGRNLNYPIALEGALKLKEISYIHAEGYPAGEMKHGPIALIDRNMPLIAIVTRSELKEKMLSNMEEAKARGASVIVLHTQNDKSLKNLPDPKIEVPDISEELSPILNVIPLQLFAYYVSVARGCDVDQPRNLAKSVTVE